MMNKRQAIGLMFITLFFIAIIGLTCEQKVNARSRAFEGAFGGALGGAMIGGLAGGGKGAGYGALAGGVLGGAIGASADDRAYYSQPGYHYEPDYYEEDYYVRPRAKGRVVRVEEEYYPNRYYRSID